MADLSNPLFSTIDANNNANAPNGYNSTTTPAQVIACENALYGALKRLYERLGPVLTSTGSANNYVVTPTNTSYPTALVQGDIYSFIANFANSGPATLTYNALTPIPLRIPGSTGLVPLSGGEIQSGQAVIVAYNGSVGQIVSIIPETSVSGGTVTSVAMNGDNVIYNTAVSGSPIVTSGTLAPSLKTQSANLFFGGPTSGSGLPSFRAVALADLPTQTGSGNIVLGTGPTINTPILVSPTSSNASLTGVPTAPTAAAATNTTQLATTAFVNGTALSLTNGTTATTQTSTDNTTKVATTAFVQTAVAGSSLPTAYAVGSYILATSSLNCTAGSTVAGSTLTPVGYNVGNSTPLNSSDGAPSGTWRAMTSTSTAGATGVPQIVLWLRIS